MNAIIRASTIECNCNVRYLNENVSYYGLPHYSVCNDDRLIHRLTMSSPKVYDES